LTPRALAKWLLGWAVASAIACFAVYRIFALDVDEARPLRVIASVWSGGELVARAVIATPADRDPGLEAAHAAHPGSTLVHESVVGEGPVLARPETALALSFVSGRDGIAVTIGERTELLTADDLLAHQAYDKGVNVASLGLSTGLDVPLALALFSQRFGMSARDVIDRGRVRRFRVVRSIPGAPSPRAIAAATLSVDDVRTAAVAAGLYLARGVDAQGRFRYLVDAPTNRTLPGYDWPRHAGATYFLAQVAELTGDPGVAWATLRAASWLRDHALVSCGDAKCIGDDPVVDVGSTALTVLAFVQVARSKVDQGYALLVPELTAFLRAQQRADGEFMHEYDRGAGRAVDVQYPYYSGEAAFALSRAHALLGDGRDLDAAARALAYLTGPAWSFFGDRYYFAEEHWTCQAMDDLWDRAPSRSALDFCLRWHAFGRRMQFRSGDTAWDADGAYGVSPLVTPRLTPVGSRSEAGIATLEAALRAGAPRAEIDALDAQLRRSLATLLRHQLGAAGTDHLFASPGDVAGAMPGSEVDWQLRIDYAQHTGSALVRWLELKRPPP
jgi:hypothetical protein